MIYARKIFFPSVSYAYDDDDDDDDDDDVFFCILSVCGIINE